jgi:tRNA nucleotidyltransferase/poly(A) polymerase
MRRLAALDEENADNIAHSLRLSRKETQYLSILMHFTEKRCYLRTKKDLVQKLYDHGKDVILDALLLCGCFYPLPIKDHLLIIKNWQKPAFPISGKLLKTIGYKQGPQMGAIIRMTEAWWRTHNFLPDKKACLNYAESLKNKVI